MASGLLDFFGGRPAGEVYVAFVEFTFGSRSSGTLKLVVQGRGVLQSAQRMLLVKGSHKTEFFYGGARIIMIETRLMFGGQLHSSGHLKHLGGHLSLIVLFSPW